MQDTRNNATSRVSRTLNLVYNGVQSRRRNFVQCNRRSGVAAPAQSANTRLTIGKRGLSNVAFQSPPRRGAPVTSPLVKSCLDDEAGGAVLPGISPPRVPNFTSRSPVAPEIHRCVSQLGFIITGKCLLSTTQSPSRFDRRRRNVAGSRKVGRFLSFEPSSQLRTNVWHFRPTSI